MGFFSNILGAVAAFFGFGAEPELAPVPEPAAIEIPAEQLPIADQEVSSDERPVEDGVVSASPDSEPMDLPETDVANGAMAGGAPAELPPAIVTPNIQTMLVAGGCFWCVEADLEKTNGVMSAVSGYAGGSTKNPTYDDYGKGGHREVVEVTYDANVVSFEDILIVTMKTTDPTDDNGTFGDRGDKYSAAFYYETAEQKEIIENLILEVDEFGPYDAPLAIDVESRPTFWTAEDFHQDYYKGTLSKLKYQYYRVGSGRTAFIEKYWGENDHSPALPWRDVQTNNSNQSYMWSNYVKPSKEELKETLDPMAYKVTQEDGTERAGTSPLDKIWEDGIYVDILSGEPLYSSKDKFDSGTGWPSFVKPITDTALTLHEDRKLFSVRTETRSAIADNHIGHVFNDGPDDRGGLRYCMNGVALEFVPKGEMEARGYGDFLDKV